MDVLGVGQPETAVGAAAGAVEAGRRAPEWRRPPSQSEDRDVPTDARQARPPPSSSLRRSSAAEVDYLFAPLRDLEPHATFSPLLSLAAGTTFGSAGPRRAPPSPETCQPPPPSGCLCRLSVVEPFGGLKTQRRVGPTEVQRTRVARSAALRSSTVGEVAKKRSAPQASGLGSQGSGEGFGGHGSRPRTLGDRAGGGGGRPARPRPTGSGSASALGCLLRPAGVQDDDRPVLHCPPVPRGPFAGSGREDEKVRNDAQRGSQKTLDPASLTTRSKTQGHVLTPHADSSRASSDRKPV